MPRHGPTHAGHVRARPPDGVTDEQIKDWMAMLVEALNAAGHRSMLIPDASAPGKVHVATEAPDEAYCSALGALLVKVGVPYTIVRK